MRLLLATASILSMLGASVAVSAQELESRAARKPTIVLVHGAFAGSSSCNSIVTDLTRDGYGVIALANTLCSVKGDTAHMAGIVHTIPGPVVLVGHSHDGEVASVAAADQANVKALVFVTGFAPDFGESAASLGPQFPTGTLGETLDTPVPLADGASNLYIQQPRYWQQFAADVRQTMAVTMAATQRPIVQSALGEPAHTQAWRKVSSWFIWESQDRNIPAALHAFMANRAKARAAVEVKGASHVIMISHPRAVANMTERAATAQ